MEALLTLGTYLLCMVTGFGSVTAWWAIPKDERKAHVHQIKRVVCVWRIPFTKDEITLSEDE